MLAATLRGLHAARSRLFCGRLGTSELRTQAPHNSLLSQKLILALNELNKLFLRNNITPHLVGGGGGGGGRETIAPFPARLMVYVADRRARRGR